MELSLETYRLIVTYVGTRSDICALCRVSRRFRMAAERSLYNTIYAHNVSDTAERCALFARQPRIAAHVEALTISLGGDGPTMAEDVPEELWAAVAQALHNTTRLRFFNLDCAGDVPSAWILDDASFSLRTFHCDLRWDAHLVEFLNGQMELADLYISDYSEGDADGVSLSPGALPALSVLECTFSEAACALLPGRPISRLKTCFSNADVQKKRAEMANLINKISLSTGVLVALDIADSSYCEIFSLELLSAVVSLTRAMYNLRYLGTLVLPIDGPERLQFYGKLRRLAFLHTVEVDVTEWEPSPSVPAGVCALAGEMRLYCPSIQRVIFVNDFERTVVCVINGSPKVDYYSITDTTWREV
ncbi:hypothetical protein CONPUDRAFT_104945 [Coniophora puteana RWD-64-598 SS2]|uniref:F-box domain-containing protein n=1 Tax=Coniophora puteana (strain RWD-64-598) TaxID=741705 RepID=A0A5M3MR39_CONPW|nr:uncharacterized protein CONPUDRAFT_104945 [Coniophora puteana RWD-64-598 SS2]EIW81540.1 hypothetical protein CONPUDRAFT_104945 [Coniophora puteana RWD-64-598 SS2]